MPKRSLPWAVLVLLLASSALAQTTSGRGMKDFHEVFGLDPERLLPDIDVVLVDTGKPLAVFYPGEPARIKLQLQNKTNRPLQAKGRFDFYRFGTKGQPGDVWVPQVMLFEQYDALPLTVELPPNGYQNVTVAPPLPATFGGYGLVLDLGEHGRDFVVGLCRAPQPTSKRLQYPKQSLDGMAPAYLERLGVQAIRMGWSYMHSAQPNFAQHQAALEERMAEMQKHRVTVVMEFGGGRYDRVFPNMSGFMRSHLDDEDNQKGGKGDAVWLPKDDDDFEKFVYDIACKYGWPKGPITGFMLWNEPWEGLSISGWGADMVRYRAIYRRIGNAVMAARRDAEVDVLIGGCDSSSNTWDKLLPEGPEESPFWPELLDFCSIHYQGMSSPCLHRDWVNRKYYKGRVLIWDTESWVANTDDRIAGLIASNRAAGYDRSLGVFYGYLCTALSHGRVRPAPRFRDDGTVEGKFAQPEHSWPAAAAFLAAQVHIGERDFREIVFQQGLPWVYAFDGLEGNPDDGTVVVLGDLGGLFNPDMVLYRTVRSLDHNTPEHHARRAELQQQLAETTDRRQQRALETELRRLRALRGTRLVIEAGDKPFHLFDFYGNAVAAEAGRFSIPLDTRGYFLRADPQIAGSFAELVAAVRAARIEGFEPVEVLPHDFLAPVAAGGTLSVTVQNILNRPVTGALTVTSPALRLAGQQVSLEPHQRRLVKLRVEAVAGELPADNSYPVTVRFDAGADGLSVQQDTLRVNLIHRRTITVDGKLDDWRGALPQIAKTDEAATRTFTEQAWLPFEGLEATEVGGFAAAFLAHDDDYFYFAAKIADTTPHEGTLRFATRDDSEFFYPEVAYQTQTDRYQMPIERVELRWPEGVRRFSYRKHPTLPCTCQGAAFDYVQIAFNAVPDDEEDWLTHLPGRMPRFVRYKCTDYEYALNMVSPRYGGGFEIWRLQSPGMVRKHFYPRQPKHQLEGPVTEAKLVTVYQDGARYTEAAIPWAELPHVKALRDAGKPVKFSYAVNHNTGGPCLELARKRSVSRRNQQAFHVDWREHWANELEFAFEED